MSDLDDQGISPLKPTLAKEAVKAKLGKMPKKVSTPKGAVKPKSRGGLG